MEKRDKAESIFDFLTAKNPDIARPEPSSRTLSTSYGWHRPKELKEWTEFNFHTLQTIYGGRLMHEACRNGRDLEFPRVSLAIDCRDENELATTHVYTVWNHRIVTESLTLVDSFNPCYWTPVSGERNAIKLSEPDAGGLSISLENATGSSRGLVEKLPKDYKVASKWKSGDILDKLDGSGTWKPGSNKNSKIMPIRQVYSYCVSRGCRYGCILTTKEAFIFQIRPRTMQPGPFENDKKIRESLATDGLMEWIAIPWENHRPRGDKDYQGLTINLALWLVHIMAGNNHEVDWQYPALSSQELPPARGPSDDQQGEPDVESSDAIPSNRRQESVSPDRELSSQKRKRDASNEDPIFLSFADKQQFDTQRTGDETDGGLDSDCDSLNQGNGGDTHGSQRSEKARKIPAEVEDRPLKRRRSKRLMQANE